MGFLTTIKSLFGIKMANDRFLQCQDCHKRFVFDAGEQEFFKSKGFSDPKRCPRCRKKVKARLSRMSRNQRGRRHRRHNSHRHSIIDGGSPYADE